MGGQHQQAGAQGAAGATQGPQTPEPEILLRTQLGIFVARRKALSVGWGCGGAVFSFIHADYDKPLQFSSFQFTL